MLKENSTSALWSITVPIYTDGLWFLARLDFGQMLQMYFTVRSEMRIFDFATNGYVMVVYIAVAPGWGNNLLVRRVLKPV